MYLSSFRCIKQSIFIATHVASWDNFHKGAEANREYFRVTVHTANTCRRYAPPFLNHPSKHPPYPTTGQKQYYSLCVLVCSALRQRYCAHYGSRITAGLLFYVVWQNPQCLDCTVCGSFPRFHTIRHGVYPPPNTPRAPTSHQAHTIEAHTSPPVIQEAYFFYTFDTFCIRLLCLGYRFP